MGTSQPAVARLESGQLDARVSTLQRYAAALGRDVQLRLSGLRSDPSTDRPAPGLTTAEAVTDAPHTRWEAR